MLLNKFREILWGDAKLTSIELYKSLLAVVVLHKFKEVGNNMVVILQVALNRVINRRHTSVVEDTDQILDNGFLSLVAARCNIA